MYEEVKEICKLNTDIYKCISQDIDTDRVVLTDKSAIHIADSHPDAYKEVLIELRDTILTPDYIIADEKRLNTGLVIKRIAPDEIDSEHTFIVLKICTDSKNGILANSIISGWKISDKRLKSYLRNKEILYKR
ncbi:MAG: PBECR2 nuclease fold domain-containing protein [Lachnospiraceae bacterium]|nr:PBECR2 nuclease fold domain-containing protein [Lachnospiraceae bacterium]